MPGPNWARLDRPNAILDRHVSFLSPFPFFPACLEEHTNYHLVEILLLRVKKKLLLLRWEKVIKYHQKCCSEND